MLTTVEMIFLTFINLTYADATVYELVAGCEKKLKCITENAHCRDMEMRCNDTSPGLPKNGKCTLDYCRKTALSEKAEGFNHFDITTSYIRKSDHSEVKLFPFENIPKCYICTSADPFNIRYSLNEEVHKYQYRNDDEIHGVYKRNGKDTVTICSSPL